MKTELQKSFNGSNEIRPGLSAEKEATYEAIYRF
jgi:hypothetical protein